MRKMKIVQKEQLNFSIFDKKHWVTDSISGNFNYDDYKENYTYTKVARNKNKEIESSPKRFLCKGDQRYE